MNMLLWKAQLLISLVGLITGFLFFFFSFVSQSFYYYYYYLLFLLFLLFLLLLVLSLLLGYSFPFLTYSIFVSFQLNDEYNAKKLVCISDDFTGV